MKLVFTDKKGDRFVLDTDNCEPQMRGGKGHASANHQGRLKLSPRLHLQLLPGQSIDLTCPECSKVRSFSKSGSHYVNLTCKICMAASEELNPNIKLSEKSSGIERMLKEMGE